MTTTWKKRYSFRLKENEAEMAEFLEKVPNSKVSEVIRQMLRFAYRQMTIEQREQKQFEMLKEQIDELKTDHENQLKEVMKSLREIRDVLEKGVSVSAPQHSRTEEGEQVDDEAVKQSAESLLSSFGVES